MKSWHIYFFSLLTAYLVWVGFFWLMRDAASWQKLYSLHDQFIIGIYALTFAIGPYLVHKAMKATKNPRPVGYYTLVFGLPLGISINLMIIQLLFVLGWIFS